MAVEHPNDLELELARTGEATEEINAHVADCEICRERRGLLDRLTTELALETVEIPPDRDAAILAVAAATAHARPKKARLRWLWAVPAAVAAAALIAIWPFVGEPTDIALAAAPDINADGGVDIVDAMLLARALKRERRSDWDANGDSHVDQRDVETIALAAVSLEGRRW